MPHHQGDLQQFEILFKQLYQRFCNKVQRIVKDREAAEDIVQEVFINYWNSPRKHEVGAPEAYLYKACINKALNQAGSLKRRVELNMQYTYNQPVEIRSPQQDMELHQLQEQLQAAIDALPPICQKVFLLSRYEQMSHKEIAAFLEISPNTVDNHIKKALAVLRKLVISVLLLSTKLYLFSDWVAVSKQWFVC